jgi:hypothetical protein
MKGSNVLAVAEASMGIPTMYNGYLRGTVVLEIK